MDKEIYVQLSNSRPDLHLGEVETIPFSSVFGSVQTLPWRLNGGGGGGGKGEEDPSLAMAAEEPSHCISMGDSEREEGGFCLAQTVYKIPCKTFFRYSLGSFFFIHMRISSF